MAIGQRVLEGRDRKSAIRRNKSTTPNGAADHAGRDDIGAVASRGFNGEGRPRPIEKGHIPQGQRYAAKGHSGSLGAELSAALERTKTGVFRHLGKNFAVIATGGLIKREIILRFSLRLEILCSDRSYLSSARYTTLTPIGSFPCVAAAELPVVTHLFQTFAPRLVCF